MSEKIIKVEKVARVEDEGWVESKAERKKVEAGEVTLPDGINPTEIAESKDVSEPDNLHQPTDANGEPLPISASKLPKNYTNSKVKK
tara:strand:- start:314 stop:574 length:261 start_codon:yes stop_codon:yes gene_type:complete